MASPDASPYVDLRIYDLDPQQLFESAIVNLRAYLPDYEPREGHTEVLLLEAWALQVAEAVFAVNRVPGAVVEVLLRLYGVARDPGLAPHADIAFTVVDDSGYTIPAGTRISLAVNSGEDQLVFATDTALVVAAGDLDAVVSATADTLTSSANGTQPGTPIELLDSVSTVERVDLVGVVAGGADAEDDASWFARGVQRFSRLTETLVLPRHFTAAVLERPEVTRAFTLDNTQPGSDVGSSAGHVTVAVYGDGGVLTSDQRTAVQSDLDVQAQANLAVHVTDPSIVTVNLSASVVALPGYTTAAVAASAEAALRAYLSPETWEWSGTVWRNELIGLLDRVDGVDRVVNITTPGGGDFNNQTLSGAAPLASAGAITITVQ